MPESSKPAVSIILPTYNRAKFLPEALAAITAQRWTDWELIVVDDGSTDNTRELVPELTRSWQQPMQYIYQENHGAYGARNTGLDHAAGKYIAFYDSDDLWLPHHLQDCVQALEASPDVDWVYGACRMVNLTTGTEIAPSTFYVDGQPRPFMSLKSRVAGNVRIIEDSSAARCQILHGLYCGLQNSVIHQRIFEKYRFDAALRNEGEDQVVVIWALASGFKFAYIDNLHVVYNVHETNSSSASLSLPVEKQRRLHEALIAGFERLKTLVPLSGEERHALAKRLGEEHFWHLGYSTHWMHGDKKAAFASFRRGIAEWPWDWRFYKTYSISTLKCGVPDRLKRCVWWMTDSQWRKQWRETTGRIDTFRAAQRRVMRELLAKHGDKILSGPFCGMRYTPAHSNTYCAHVLLGTYERELFELVELICESGYDTIVDIGTSDGFYLCGFAFRRAAARIVGFELDQRLHRRVREFACANNLLETIELKGACDVDSLRQILSKSGRTLVLCDIDGAEYEIMNPAAVPALLDVDVLVETHDILRPNITSELMSRFESTHSIVEIPTTPRNPKDLPANVTIREEDILLAMDEFRGGLQSWLWMTPRATSGTHSENEYVTK